MNSDSSSDLSSSCRVCLKKDSGTLKSLLNTYLDTEWYPDIFLKCTTIKVIDKLEHPPWICEDCDAELIRAYRFRTKCIESDAVLSAVFVKTENVKTEELEIVECLIKEEDTSSEKSLHGNDYDDQSSESDFKEESESESELSKNEDDFKKENQSKKRKYNKTSKKEEKSLEICKVCNEPLPSAKIAYNKHISTHDPGNPTPFECKLCDKKYKTSSQLAYHVKGHTFHINCKYCDEKFRTNLSKTIHERRKHTFIRPYKCDICEDISYYTKTELNDHNGRRHLPKILPCDICNKMFGANCELLRHRRIHKAELNFQCTICGKNFPSAAGVKSHEKIVHSTEERFFCEKCSLSFSKKPALWKHNRTVHRFDECVCNVCGKVYDSVEHLRKHTLYHDEEYKFSCPVCPTKKFARMFLLRRHVKASHPTVELPPTVRKIGKKSKVWKEKMMLEGN